MSSEGWPTLLQKLKDQDFRVIRLTPKAESRYDLFELDLSRLKLSFSDRTPTIWIRKNWADLLSPDELFGNLLDVVRTNEWNLRGRIVLMEGAGGQLKQMTAGQHLTPTVIFDAADQKAIVEQLPLTNRLLEVICAQIPIGRLAPYTTGKTVEGGQFFGRHAEIARVLRHHDANFAIVSERRLGKTCLIKELRRRLEDQGEDEKGLIYYDCSLIDSLSQFVEALVGELTYGRIDRLWRGSKPAFYFQRLLRQLSRGRSHRITFFLDELDWLISQLRQNNELNQVLSLIRASANAGYCRFIFAGSTLLREELNRQQSPLYKWAEIVSLKPFDNKELEEIVLHPMRSLCVRVEDGREIVGRILADTHGHPLFVQFYCLELIKQLELWQQAHPSERPYITPDHVSTIYKTREFKEFVTDTFLYDVGAREQALVYALLNYYPENQQEFTFEEIYRAVKNQGNFLSVEQVEAGCASLSLATVLTQTDDGYQFVIGAFPRALRARFGNLEYLLDEKIEALVR